VFLFEPRTQQKLKKKIRAYSANPSFFFSPQIGGLVEWNLSSANPQIFSAH
jgi:hypothetical protein